MSYLGGEDIWSGRYFAGVFSEAPPVEYERPELDYEIEVCESALSRNANQCEVLRRLGAALTRAGRFEEGLDVDRRLLRLTPEDPIAHYNMACSYSLMGSLDEAFSSLNRSIDLGYRDLDHLLHDQDIDPLRRDPRYRGVLQRLS